MSASDGPARMRWTRYIVQSPTGVVRTTRWTTGYGLDHLPDTTFQAEMLARFRDAHAGSPLVLVEHEPDPATGDTSTLFGSIEVVRAHVTYTDGERPHE